MPATGGGAGSVASSSAGVLPGVFSSAIVSWFDSSATGAGGGVLQDHVRGERSAASLMVRRRTFTPSSGVQRSLTYSRTAAGG
jgi:hypothetical protein